MENITNKLTVEGQRLVVKNMEDIQEGITEDTIEAEKIIERKKKEWYFSLVLDVLGTLLTTFTVALMLGDKMLLPSGIDSSVLGGLFASMNGYTFVATISGTLFTLLCSCYGLSDFITLKKLKKYLNGLKSEKIELEKILTTERQKLKELEENKETVNKLTENEVSPAMVVSGLLNLLAIHGLCGINEKNWSKLYKCGRLPKKLKKYDCTPAEIKEAEKFFEEKGHSRRRVRTR